MSTLAPPRGVVADLTALSELDAMIEAIAAAWPDSLTPPDLRADCIAFQTQHKDRVGELRAMLLLTIGAWLREAEKHGVDRHVAEQVAAAHGHAAIASMMRAAKERRGEPFVPARLAIVAYHMADNVAGASPFACDLDAAVDAWERGCAEAAAEQQEPA